MIVIVRLLFSGKSEFLIVPGSLLRKLFCQILMNKYVVLIIRRAMLVKLIEHQS